MGDDKKWREKAEKYVEFLDACEDATIGERLLARYLNEALTALDAAKTEIADLEGIRDRWILGEQIESDYLTSENLAALKKAKDDEDD